MSRNYWKLHRYAVQKILLDSLRSETGDRVLYFE